jgi:hypothetical protein
MREHGTLDPSPALSRGAARGKVVFLDAFSGIAGDMTVGALVDLGVPFAVVEGAVHALGLEGLTCSVQPARSGAIAATRFDVQGSAGTEEREYAQIETLLAGSALEPGVGQLARDIFRRLAEAESRVHGVPLQRVHFHEVGAGDAIFDIVGAAACFCYLAGRVVVTSLPMGRGFVNSRHGVLPLPAPAVVECLLGLPTVDAGIDAELVTPTGAAIVASVAHEFARWPAMRPERVGWGWGSQSLPDRPNLLRVVLGTPIESKSESGGEYVVIEANVDDMTGELAAHAIDALLGCGALDAWTTPINMKKGRPGLIISALVRTESEASAVSAMLRETSSIGVRRTPVSRTERPRRLVQVRTRFGEISVKVSEGPYGPPQVKAEFEQCARAAASAGVPVRLVIEEVLRVYASMPGA